MIGAYIFNEKQPGRIYDFSGQGYDLDTISNIGYSSVLSDGYDAVFGIGTVSYATSSKFTLPAGQQAISICLRIKCASAPGSSYVLLKKGTDFEISINSSGYVVFALTGGTTLFTKTSSVNVCDGNYHSIICVADGSTLKIYTDGIPESTAAVYSTIASSASILYMGSSSSSSTSPYYVGNISYLIISQYALSANDAANLTVSQKGIAVETAGTSLVIGDIFSDPTDTVQGVVIWTPDGININILPYTPYQDAPLYKTGHIYNTFRQNLMSIATDYDGNGNGQISIMPGNNINGQVWNYRGLVAFLCHWFCEFQQRQNNGAVTTNLYTETLLANSLVENGDLFEFEYWLNSVNGGTVNVLFNNSTLASFTAAASTKYTIRGTVVLTDIIHQDIVYNVEVNGVIYRGSSSTFNFKTNLRLNLQVIGTASGDLVGIGGKGRIERANFM